MTGRTLAGRVALVTGVSRRIGIGAAIACRLAQAGADLLLTGWTRHDDEMPWDADLDGPDHIVADARSRGVRAEYLAADLAVPAAPVRVVNAAVAAYGRLDILVANHARSSMQALEDLTADEIDLSYVVNTRATMLLVKEFAARHADQPGGRVIFMTSGQHRGPMPGELPYIASKGALHQLTASLSAHLAPRGISVNCVDPGATDTGYADVETWRAVRDLEPMARWGEPDDAARLIAWLACDEARWITGQVIVSSGGGP